MKKLKDKKKIVIEEILFFHLATRYTTKVRQSKNYDIFYDSSLLLCISTIEMHNMRIRIKGT